MNQTSNETPKHTPGPWRVGTLRNGSPRIAGPSNATVCVLHMGNGTADADARLIAAAPDLLAALEEVLRMEGEQVQSTSAHFEAWLNRKYRALEAARAAIAKAEGSAS